MGFLKSKKGSEISDYFQLVTTIGNYQAGNMYDLALYNDHLEISSPLVKNKISLNYDQITDVFYGFETKLVELKKSVIGRALIGGLLFGSAGSNVGAISGLGTKTKKEKHLYLIISYTGSDGEDKFIQFEDTRKYKGDKLSQKLKEFANIQDEIVMNDDIQL